MADGAFVLDRSRGRIIAGLLGLMAAGFVYERVATTVDHSRLAVYQLPPVAVATTIAAALVAELAVAAAVASARPLAAGVALATTVVLLTGLFLFPLLLLAAGGFVVLRRLVAGLPRRQAGLCVVAGVIAGLAGVVVWTVSSQPPLVRCLRGGGTESSDRAWWGGSSGGDSGGGTAYAGGGGQGWIVTGGTRYDYTCSAAGKLTAFRVTRPAGTG